ncbi:PH domain-containing protein [Amnibacterium flavum]|uniref:YdbS-like PH domain-containing protein n=1 Tax=Amnibacterium flavum TaxID=2173173 RepID=A0A2V1HRH0_9MICO|nr:PH domain-containing protein [Amnibacterium flavum]PVZ95216.1 hypothetical protein DDQ50_01415 [Amnibacterium flavum]
MTDEVGPPAPPATAAAPSALADGEWHRLHPATPLLRGGIALIAIAGLLVANLRDRVIEFVIQQDEADPIDLLIERGWLIPGLLIVLGVILLAVLGFYLSWRFHEFRVTDEVVEVRSGIVFRTFRKARLDRIQGINIVRPFIARIFGAARLQISVAGNDAEVKLDYLSSSAADQLRRDVLSLASGVQREERVADARARTTGVIGQRIDELLAPELDPREAAAESVVRLPLPRLIGSMLLRDSTIILILLLVVGIPVMFATDTWYLLLGVIPSLIGLAGFIVNRFSRSLRYSIAATPNGVRIGYGLLSTSNETLPPGRIHAIHVSQPILWRLPGWWQIQITRAGSNAGQSGGSTSNPTVLPVGDRQDVARVLGLLLPGHADEQIALIVDDGLLGTGADDEAFTSAPRRARWLRPLSWRRTGFALWSDLFLMRKGRIWRSVTVVPLARMQSVALAQGPIYRALRLAEIYTHIVSGPIYARLGAIDAEVARRLFLDVVAGAEREGRDDRTHRWNRRVDQSDGGTATARVVEVEGPPSVGEVER